MKRKQKVNEWNIKEDGTRGEGRQIVSIPIKRR